MSAKIYIYQKCSTCRNAMKWLDAQGVDYQSVAIREEPPTVAELERAISAKGSIRGVFNTSGIDYRAMQLKDKLPTMSKEQALDLLTSNGNLVKRPLLLTSETVLIGFKEPEWTAQLGS